MDRNSRCWLHHDKCTVPKSATEEKIARDEERFRGLRASSPFMNLTWIYQEFARLIANNDESTSDTRETTNWCVLRDYARLWNWFLSRRGQRESVIHELALTIASDNDEASVNLDEILPRRKQTVERYYVERM